MTCSCCKSPIELKTAKKDDKWYNYWFCEACDKVVEPSEPPPSTYPGMSEDTYTALIYGWWRP